MDFMIRRLVPEELDPMLELAWKTYLEFEAPDYEPQGVETFRRDVVENEAFKQKCRSGDNRMWGAFDGEKLVGIFVMRGKSHISLVFIHRDYHRKGAATAIFRLLLKDVWKENPDVHELTLNSSPYGRPFYHHVGFQDADIEKTIDGIRFTPMVYMLRPCPREDADI